MRLKVLFTLLASSASLFVNAQTTKISGTVLDNKKKPMPGVNVFIKDSYDGTSTDVEGKFSFTTSDTGKVTLTSTMVGFEMSSQDLSLTGKPILLNFILKESINELKTVTINTGSIEASDSKRVAMLKPLDIVTTASAQGDILEP